jgi:hypothetical protein
MKKLVLLTVLCFTALSAGAQSPELFLQMGHSGTINAVAQPERQADRHRGNSRCQSPL